MLVAGPAIGCARITTVSNTALTSRANLDRVLVVTRLGSVKRVTAGALDEAIERRLRAANVEVRSVGVGDLDLDIERALSREVGEFQPRQVMSVDLASVTTSGQYGTQLAFQLSVTVVDVATKKEVWRARMKVQGPTGAPDKGAALIADALLKKLGEDGVLSHRDPPRSEILADRDDLQPGSRLEAYLTSPYVREGLVTIGHQFDAMLGLHVGCKGPYSAAVANFAVYAPIDFPADRPHPVKGTWHYRFDFTRCGQTKTYNAVFIARDGGHPPDVLPYYPGSSIASPRLVRDSLPDARVVARAKIAKAAGHRCHRLEVFDMQVATSPDPSTGWKEAWSFRGCGHTVEVEITFIPTPGGGTSYIIEPITPAAHQLPTL